MIVFLQKNKDFFCYGMLLLFVFLCFLSALFFIMPFLIYFMQSAAMHISCFYGDCKATYETYLGESLPFIQTEAWRHSNVLSVIFASCIYLTLIAYLPFLRIRKTGKILIALLACIGIAGNWYFVYEPEQFPLSTLQYQKYLLYMQVLLWYIETMLYLFTLILVRSSLLIKCYFALGWIGFIVLFGITRYIFFVFLWQYGSHILLPLVLFTGAPIVDAFAIISFYSLYVSLSIQQQTQTSTQKLRAI